MWTRHVREKVTSKKKMFLPFFFCPCIQSYLLACCASFYQPAMEKGTLHSYTPGTPPCLPGHSLIRGPGRLSGVRKEAESPRRGCVLWKPLHISALCREPRAGCSFPSKVCMKSLPSFLPSSGDLYFSGPDALAQCSICCMPNTHSFLTKAFFNCLKTASGHI